MLTLSGAADIAEFIAVARFTVIAAVIRKLTNPANADLARAGDAIITIRRAVRTRDTIGNLAILTDTALKSVIRAGVAVITIRRAVRTRDTAGRDRERQRLIHVRPIADTQYIRPAETRSP